MAIDVGVTVSIAVSMAIGCGTADSVKEGTKVTWGIDGGVTVLVDG